MSKETTEQKPTLNAYTYVSDKNTSVQEATMVTLYFTKQFTGGLLKGLRSNQSMRFASMELAAEFLKFGRKGCKKAVLGSSPWKIVDASFQKYWRY